jgi:hypothetical protein
MWYSGEAIDRLLFSVMDIGFDGVDTQLVQSIAPADKSNTLYISATLEILLATVWTLFLTTIPVIANIGPDNYYANHPKWFTGNDVMRFIEPLGGALLNFLVFQSSGITRKAQSLSSDICIYSFVFGLAFYVQGAGFHSASNMFKNSLETIQDEHDDTYYDSLHYYMRNVWEHAVSHYVYAIGLVLMHLCQAWAYKDFKAPTNGLPIAAKVSLVCSSLLLALLIFLVALQFPSGTIVGFIYLLCYGMCIVGGYHAYLYRYRDEKKALTEFGYLPILHHFFVAYCVALAMLIIWIISVGGFYSRVEATGK